MVDKKELIDNIQMNDKYNDKRNIGEKHISL